ncbi:MAG: hypothetical protein GXO47_02010 [Chlorobi bacterium]|nr:hypothetical protein [Chlorobiota bacterium]
MKTFILIFFVFISQLAYGQTAHELYDIAKDYYKARNYTESLQQLDKTQLMLGRTNAAIEHVRVKCYYYLKRYDDARKSLIEFYKYPASAELIEEMKEYEKKISLAELKKRQDKLKKQKGN